MTTVQPAAKAGPSFLVTMAIGKFQGPMITHSPTGSLTTKFVLPGCCDVIISP